MSVSKKKIIFSAIVSMDRHGNVVQLTSGKYIPAVPYTKPRFTKDSQVKQNREGYHSQNLEEVNREVKAGCRQRAGQGLGHPPSLAVTS